ncbi:hypothetical protein HWI79_195 [Cryptosporidium felis]|nr:hypothetical protein HWI79_195 [Cryptosporidium felis]
MSIIQEFKKLRQNLDDLFSSRELIDKQIQEKASKLYKLNSECISLSNRSQDENIEALCLEICNYMSEVLQVKLSENKLKPLVSNKTNEHSAEIRKVIQINSISENDVFENKKSTIHPNNYAFRNIYKIDDFMNTTSWLWSNELKSKIVDVVSNKSDKTQNIMRCTQKGGNFAFNTQVNSKKQCNVIPKLVCKTVKVEGSKEYAEIKDNPLKDYIERAFKPEPKNLEN